MAALENSGEALIQAHHLRKHFAARVAVRDLSLEVRAGQLVGLVGANGGGKSTILKMLAGLLRSDGGNGTVLGWQLPKQSQHIRACIGYLPQRTALYPTLSVRENLRFRATVYDLPNAKQAADAQMREFDLLQFANLPIEQLSGGWARQLGLAAALVHRPRVVLLDEPTAGLDPVVRQQLWRRIASLAGQGCAVVISTHDVAEAQRCSSVLLLNAGVVCASGTPNELAQQSQAHCVVARGASLLRVADECSRLKDVVATYPQGDALRIVANKSAAAQVAAWLHERNVVSETVEPTLEDAALLLVQAKP